MRDGSCTADLRSGAMTPARKRAGKNGHAAAFAAKMSMLEEVALGPGIEGDVSGFFEVGEPVVGLALGGTTDIAGDGLDQCHRTSVGGSGVSASRIGTGKTVSGRTVAGESETLRLLEMWGLLDGFYLPHRMPIVFGTLNEHTVVPRLPFLECWYASRMGERARWLVGAGVGLLAVGAWLPGYGLWLRWLAVGLLGVFALRRKSLTPWIFVAMVAGVELGLDAPRAAVELRVLSDVFLRLIKTIVAPLILGTLITGIAGQGDMKSVRRMAWKSLVYFEVVTTLALVIGLVAIHVTKAGVGLKMPALHARSEATLVPATPPRASSPGEPPVADGQQHWQDFVVHVFPENLAKSIYEGQILQVSVFAVLFGIALATLPMERRTPMLRLTESLSEVMFGFTNLVMYFAPVAVGAALAYTVGSMGAGVLLNLGKLVLTYYGALLVLFGGVMVPVMWGCGIPVGGFLKAVAEPAGIAFATTSSEAALPRAMEAMEAFGVPRRVVAFVIPAGYSFNMDGAAVYLTLAAMFVAQAAGLHLRLGEQVGMVLMLMLTSKGVSGVPRATLMVLMASAASLQLPAEPIVVILGIDAVMDMGRTTANVVGNCLASAVVAKWESEFRAGTPSPAMVEGNGNEEKMLCLDN